jgi:hypothetical protein
MTWWCAASSEPWSWTWRAYPGIWLFVTGLAAWGVAALRGNFAREREGAGARHAGRIAAYAAGVLFTWLALDWPLGRLGGGYLLSAHTAQYVLLSFFAAPLLLLGLERRPGDSAGLPGVNPLVSLGIYNLLLTATHVPAIVDAMMPTQWARRSSTWRGSSAESRCGGRHSIRIRSGAWLRRSAWATCSCRRSRRRSRRRC